MLQHTCLLIGCWQFYHLSMYFTMPGQAGKTLSTQVVADTSRNTGLPVLVRIRFHY